MNDDIEAILNARLIEIEYKLIQLEDKNLESHQHLSYTEFLNENNFYKYGLRGTK